MNTKVNYSALEMERNSEVRANFEAIFRKKPTGNPGTLRGNVLSQVLEGNYELALKEIEDYSLEKKDFPTFKVKAQRYITHCKELIMAIQGKREFQGLSLLPVSKQKDMFDKIMNHYDELTTHIRQIEAIGHETFLDDIRSTVIVLKTLTFWCFLILILALTMDLFGNVFSTYNKVLFDLSGDLTSWVFEFIGI